MATKTGVKSGAGRSYTAAPKDNTLPSHLHEAFKLLEIRFANYDHDGAEMLMFKELERELSLVGFSDPKLEATFKRFDFDGVFTQMLLKANRLCISFGPASLSYIPPPARCDRFDCSSGNGTLDFGEFLCLMYFWEEHGDYAVSFM